MYHSILIRWNWYSLVSSVNLMKISTNHEYTLARSSCLFTTKMKLGLHSKWKWIINYLCCRVFEFYLLSEHFGCRWSRMTPLGQTQRVNFISRFKAIHNAPKSEQLAWKIIREIGLLDQTELLKKRFTIRLEHLR